MTRSYAQTIPVASTSPATFAAARAYADETERELCGVQLMGASHDALESYVAGRGREWARLALEAQFALRAEREKRVEVVDTAGVAHESSRASLRHVETVVGTVAAPRLAYQEAGREDLHPLDALLNLPRESFSYGVREMVARESARSSFDEVVDIVSKYTNAKIDKRQVEQLAERAAQDFDLFYELRQLERDPTLPLRRLLVISTDGKGIVVRRKDLREATRKRAEAAVKEVETRLTPGQKRNRKRMAQVASVYEIEAWVRTSADVVHGLRDGKTESKRPKPRRKRVWASVRRSAREVIGHAFDEALRRDPDKTLRWVVLIDGDAKQLDAVKAEAKRVGVEITIVVDVVHVLEYVWKAARAIFGETNAQAEGWVSDRFLALLSGQRGSDVARTIRWWANERAASIDAAGRKLIKTACGYLANRTRGPLMRYAEFLRDGLPIATGVIEGACRYLVKDRMDRTGARWSLTGAEAVLRLRALLASGDFDAYWKFHLLRQKQRVHETRYANAAIPDPLRARPSHLRAVK